MSREKSGSGPIHPVRTDRHQFGYVFYTKHHGGGLPGQDARWDPALSHGDEFEVFNQADRHDLFDDGDYYGVGRDGSGNLRELGVWSEQVAKFEHARPGELWHGYPDFPIDKTGPPSRRKQGHHPSKALFDKMVAAGVLRKTERDRLVRGKHA